METPKYIGNKAWANYYRYFEDVVTMQQQLFLIGYEFNLSETYDIYCDWNDYCCANWLDPTGRTEFVLYNMLYELGLNK